MDLFRRSLLRALSLVLLPALLLAWAPGALGADGGGSPGSEARAAPARDSTREGTRIQRLPSPRSPRPGSSPVRGPVEGPPPVPGRTEGHLTLGSSYVWRGLDASAGEPVVAGQLVRHLPHGVFLAVSGSTVDFQGGPGADPRFECLLDLGITRTRGESRWTLALETGRYPNATALDFDEAHLSWERSGTRLLLAWSPHYFGGESASTFGSLRQRFHLGPFLGSDATVLEIEYGYSRFTDPAAAGLADYGFLLGALERPLGDWTARLQYTHTEPGAVGFPVARWAFSLSHPY